MTNQVRFMNILTPGEFGTFSSQVTLTISMSDIIEKCNFTRTRWCFYLCKLLFLALKMAKKWAEMYNVWRLYILIMYSLLRPKNCTRLLFALLFLRFIINILRESINYYYCLFCLFCLLLLLSINIVYVYNFLNLPLFFSLYLSYFK